jgi:16S rRNA (adenine1518-N6/adenine1519-N6)-dimethyltransferase
MALNDASADARRTREDWRGILKSRGIRPEKSMGQNFLTDPDVVSAIVAEAEVTAGTLVVEVGPGMGILTRELLRSGANVLAVELDRDLARFLRHDLRDAGNLTLMEADARYVDIEAWRAGRPWHLVANLPYSTGTVILRHFLDMPTPPASSTVMVQREVAERMAATVPDMSLLALAVQIHTEPHLMFVVPPEVFDPPPKVDSAVIRLTRRPAPLLDEEDRRRLFAAASMAFQQKRKTLANSLANGTKQPKSAVELALSGLGLDPGVRPQAVSLEDWCRIAKAGLA